MNKYEPIYIGYTQFIIFRKQKKRIIILSLLNKVKTRLWKANQDQETKEKQEVYIGIIRLLDFFNNIIHLAATWQTLCYAFCFKTCVMYHFSFVVSCTYLLVRLLQSALYIRLWH